MSKEPRLPGRRGRRVLPVYSLSTDYGPDIETDHAPGLDGTDPGSCIVCLGGTDTALAFRGVAEWHAAGLVDLGLPMEHAVRTAQGAEAMTLQGIAAGDETVEAELLDGMVVFEASYRVCCACVADANARMAHPFPPPRPVTGEVPLLVQRTRTEPYWS